MKVKFGEQLGCSPNLTFARRRMDVGDSAAREGRMKNLNPPSSLLQRGDDSLLLAKRGATPSL